MSSEWVIKVGGVWHCSLDLRVAYIDEADYRLWLVDLLGWVPSKCGNMG